MIKVKPYSAPDEVADLMLADPHFVADPVNVYGLAKAYVRLRDALQWYADENNWNDSSFSINHKIIEQTIAAANHDRGKRAREALAGEVLGDD